MKWFEKYNKYIEKIEGVRIPEFYKHEKFEPLWEACFKSEWSFPLEKDPKDLDCKVEDTQLIMFKDLDKIDYPFYCSLSNILFPQEIYYYGRSSYVVNFGEFLDDRIGPVIVDHLRFQNIGNCNRFRGVPRCYNGFISNNIEIKKLPLNLEEWPSALLAHFIYRKFRKTIEQVGATGEISLRELIDSFYILETRAWDKRALADDADLEECFSLLNRSIIALMSKRNICPPFEKIGEEWDKVPKAEEIEKEDRDQEINNPIDVFRNYITV